MFMLIWLSIADRSALLTDNDADIEDKTSQLTLPVHAFVLSRLV